MRLMFKSEQEGPQNHLQAGTPPDSNEGGNDSQGAGKEQAMQQMKQRQKLMRQAAKAQKSGNLDQWRQLLRQAKSLGNRAGKQLDSEDYQTIYHND